MTNDEMRIAIAEACGWRMVEGLAAFPPAYMVERYLATLPKQVADSIGCIDYCEVPDYINDLNAMHEAEKILNFAHYIKNLAIAVGGSGTIANMIHATASQRAEAFLRTIGKWKD